MTVLKNKNILVKTNSVICYSCKHYGEDFNNLKKRCKNCVEFDVDEVEGLIIKYKDFETEKPFSTKVFAQVMEKDSQGYAHSLDIDYSDLCKLDLC